MEISKSIYEAQLVEEFAHNNSNKIYKYINSILHNNSLPVAMHLNSHTATSDADKASLFNEYFESVYSKPTSNASHTHTLCSGTSVLNNIALSDTEVYTALSSLDPFKASGTDCIGPRILKTCSLALYPVVDHLFKMSLASCKLPKEWKLHCIIPIFKSGDKSLISNYRPISLLCSISKVLERIVYDKVFGFIGQSISKSQYGFLRDHSCLQQLLSFLSCVEKSLESRCQHDTIYLDFQKAFDRVPHKELLFKLHDLGITGALWRV